VPSQHAVASPGPSHSAAQRDNALLTPLGSSTHSLLCYLPRTCYREIGPREIARVAVLSRESKPRRPDGQSQPRVVLTRSTSLGLSTLPSTETPMSREYATWTPLRLRGPTLPRPLRDFADRGILAPSPLLLESPTHRIPDTPDSCHLSLQESTVPIKSRNRPS
jgi:hypothetical protein